MKMKICKKCQKEFPYRIEIEGKLRNCDKRKFCFECSPFGKHNTKDITKYQSYIFEEGGIKYKKCPSCLQILEINKKNYFIRDNGITHYYCKSCLNKKSLEFQNNRKDECIRYKGGKCNICGYSKCRNALEFHHRDPSKKDFEIGKDFRKKSLKDIKNEIDKCDLVCANCHREIHYGTAPVHQSISS